APMVQPPGPGQMMPSGQLGAPGAAPEAPDAGASNGRQGAADATEQTASTGAAAPPASGQIAGVAPPPPPSINLPAVEPGAGSLERVPVAELVEDSQYGPLPRIASDGRRPLDVYARPSRYAAKGGAGDPARIAILVTGLGLADSPPVNVLKGLPPSISVAYGAYGRSLQDGVTIARADGHEVLLQIPLEPNNYPTENPGPHTLLTTLPPDENMKRLEWLMSRYTGYVGVTNLMGAKFEATQTALTPVLEEMKSRGLLYVDDGSVQGSTAGQIASTIGLDYSAATVQINDASPADIAKQLAKLESEAKEKGAAIGVVKAKPATLKQIAEWASKVQSKGFVLVPVSAVVRSQSQS
ncbi:MAG: divergent polysaccharide deacetylase family protein, partial [Methyloceanibacter sp.]